MLFTRSICNHERNGFLLHLQIVEEDVIDTAAEIPAGATGREEKPVHKDASTVVVRVVSQESVPFVFLLAGTISVAAKC